VNDSIDEMFSVYVNSNEFVTAKNLSRLFNEKLNYTGDFELINSKSKCIEWLELNWEETNFTSLNQAVNLRTELFTANVNMYNNFPLVYDFIAEANDSIVYEKLSKWVFTDNTITNNNKKCTTDFKDCENKAKANLKTTIKTLKDSDMSNNEKESAADAATETANEQMETCGKTYKDCVLK